MTNWYYVQDGERHGPIDEENLISIYQEGKITEKDYVWKKGFENWQKIIDTPEIFDQLHQEEIQADELPQFQTLDINALKKKEETSPINEQTSSHYFLSQLNQEENKIYIRIGSDRGQSVSVDYGPYNFAVIKKLYDEKRINSSTLIFELGMDNWIPLSAFKDFSDFFGELPPKLNMNERRSSERKPFLARLFFSNSGKVFEGICRDISIGGMQVLMDSFPGKIGDQISLNVHPDNSSYQFVADGVVVRILDGNLGFSFRFQELDEQSLQAIKRFINDN